jgi:hypothetical protein
MQCNEYMIARPGAKIPDDVYLPFGANDPAKLA